MGRHLSMVQHKGSIILELIEHRERGINKAESDFRRFREAVVASGHPKREVLFPEYFPIKEQELGDGAVPADAKVDYSNVEWKMPSNAKDEYETLMAQVASHRSGTFGSDSLMDPDAGWR